MDFKCLWFAAEHFPGRFHKAHFSEQLWGALGRTTRFLLSCVRVSGTSGCADQVTRARECRASGSSSQGAHQELKLLAALKA